VTNIIAQSKQDSPSLLGDIHNLVFQGGGIKGLAYLGSLQQLQIEGEKEGKDFLSGVRRIAGTSAGSMVALYLGLNLDLENDIKPLLARNFVDLLDESLILKVIVELNLVWSYKYKNFRAKDIFLTAMKYFEDLEARLNSGDKKVEEKAEKETGELVAEIIKYCSTKVFGAWATKVAGCLETALATQATKWLLTMLKPTKHEDPIKHQDPKKHVLKAAFPDSSSSDGPSRFEDIVNRECDKALIEASHEDMDEHGKPKSVDTEGLQMPSQENDHETLKSAAPKSKATKQEGSRMKADASEYLLRKGQDIKPDPASELKGTLLYHALAETVYFLMMSQQNAEGIRTKLGLFDGSIVKKELIEDPIKKVVGNLHQDPANITFQELWDLNTKLPAEKKLKKFYVTSFNVETFRTEVFSAEHTPNVVVADAVRASMSIPVFFTPVTIRERTDKGLTPRKIYSTDITSAEIHYMDGGVLDNYPIWIFDDFKYCVQDIPEFKPRMRYAMQNPRTLGFRLMESRIIDIYTNPYFDPEKKRMKQINEKKYQETFFYQIGLLLNTEINQTQENEHIKRGDCARTAYVDNLGMSAIQFVLTPADVEKLINSGAQSVLNYKSRAALNGFVGEGEAYF